MHNRVRIASLLLPLACCLLISTASLAAQSDRSTAKLDALVTGAMKSADGRFLRAEQAIEKAGKHRRGTAKWFSLMNIARTNYRVAFRSLDRFKRAKISAETLARHAKVLKESTARLVDIYKVLIDEYLAAGSRSTAARLVGELKRVSPKEAAKMKPKLAKDVFGRKPKIGDVDVGPTYTPRTRAGRRLTGEDARYLGRRGYRPPGNPNTGRPSAPPTPPRPATRPPSSGGARGGSTGGGSVGRR